LTEHGGLYLDGGHIQGILLPYANSLFEDCINKNETEESPKELPCIINTVQVTEYNPAHEILSH